MRRVPLVYLAGGIAGCDFDAATDWRKQAQGFLRDRGIETLNPMRAKDALGATGRISDTFRSYEKRGAFFTAGGIMTRDSNDVMTCDALLVNLLKPTLSVDSATGKHKPSLGTVMELGWGFILQKPVVVAIEADGSNPHDNHPMIDQCMRFRVETIEEAIDAVAVVLNR